MTDEASCFKDASLLLNAVVSAIEGLEQAETQIILAAPGGDFRVRITATRHQLIATPLRRNEKGEWVPEEHSQGPLARWQLQPNGGFVRIV